MVELLRRETGGRGEGGASVEVAIMGDQSRTNRMAGAHRTISFWSRCAASRRLGDHPGARCLTCMNSAQRRNGRGPGGLRRSHGRSGSTRHIRARQSGHVTDASSVLDPAPSSEPQAVPSVMKSTR